MRLALAVAVALVATFPLAALAGSAKDACGLLTRAEVVAAIGEPVKTVKGGVSSTGAIYCNWTGSDSHLLARGIALIAATDYVTQRYKSYVALMKPATSVSGIGLAAVTDGTAILARNGRVFVSVAPLFKGTGITFGAIKALAKRVLAHGS